MEEPRFSVPPAWTRRVYAALIAACLGAFAYEVHGLARAASALESETGALEARARQLDDSAREQTAVVRRIDAESGELKFLQELPNLLPRDKSYLRVQKAISADVAQLRSKMKGKLKRGVYVVVDSKANKLYVKDGLRLLWSADCSVGSGGWLVDRATGRRWRFVTPRGRFKVVGKLKDPVWRKPDWAFVEEGARSIPPPDDPSRFLKGQLGAYALNLGDGYLIHGTKDEASLGRPASHGCVRLGAADLKRLYDSVPEGSPVFIF
jgi:L,D-transpeptidase ErfK/SrfK